MALAQTNLIPALLEDARIYKDGYVLLGVGNIELPSIEYMSETLSGFGLGGEIEVPVKGNFKSMTVKIKWNTVEPEAVQLLETTAHHLDIRGSVEKVDAGTGEFLDLPVKLVLQAAPKTNSLGTMEPAKKMDGETELEVTYLKLWINGVEEMEIDKLNFICRIQGTDLLQVMRINLGMI